MWYVIVGVVCLVVGVALGATYVEELEYQYQVVREWVFGLLVLVGAAAIVWVLLHYAAHVA